MTEREQYMGIDNDDINKMQNYITEYNNALKCLKNLIDDTNDVDLKDTIEWLLDGLETNEKSRYDEYLDTVYEWENFNKNDYYDNDGINQDRINDIYGGLR